MRIGQILAENQHLRARAVAVDVLAADVARLAEQLHEVDALRWSTR